LPLHSFWLESIEKQQHGVSVGSVAAYLLEFHPAKLLPGLSIEHVHDTLRNSWKAYRNFNPDHDVYTRFPESLHMCVPCKLHSDKGTGLRRSAVMQYSWGGVMADAPNSFDRYFFWCSILGEEYKKAHAGYETGNVVLDEICEELVRQCREVYQTGVRSPGFDCVFHLAWVGLEGDLPALARAFRCKRNFARAPNQLCYWCEVDDKSVPFTDNRSTAIWRGTVHQTRPWTTRCPLSMIPGAETEVFLTKDLFHLCHLGAVRGFCANLLCYLVRMNHFVSCQKDHCNILSIYIFSYVENKTFGNVNFRYDCIFMNISLYIHENAIIFKANISKGFVFYIRKNINVGFMGCFFSRPFLTREIEGFTNINALFLVQTTLCINICFT